MTKTVTAHYNGSAFIPDEPVEMPEGSEVMVQLISTEKKDSTQPVVGLRQLAALLKKLPPDPDAPSDGAAQHDHYLYGTAKR